MILFAILFVFISCFVYFRFTRKRMYELSDPVPCWKALPLIGHLHFFCNRSTEHLLKVIDSISSVANQHNGVAKAWLGPKLYYAITDPKDTEIVLNTCLEKDYFYKFGAPWVGEGLITASVPTWKRHLKKIAPSFNQNVLDGFVEIFDRQSRFMVDQMRVHAGKGEFDAYTYIGPATLEIICQTAMGTPMDQQKIVDPPYLEAVHKILNILVNRATNPFLHPQFIYNLTSSKRQEDECVKILHHVSNTVVAKKRLQLENDKKLFDDITEYTDETRPFRAFLDLMMELKSKEGALTDEELREEVDTMIVAGQESTGFGILLAIILLGSHQDVQEKVYQELKEIFQDSNRPIEKADLGKMVYLEAVLKETLRLYPVIPLIVRTVDKEVKLSEYILPEGSACAVSIWGIHRSKKLWGPDADQFNPERWFASEKLPKHACAYAPFSFGRRICLGKVYAMMSMKTALANTFRVAKFQSDISKLRMKVDVLLKPIAGHLVTMELR